MSQCDSHTFDSTSQHHNDRSHKTGTQNRHNPPTNVPTIHITHASQFTLGDRVASKGLAHKLGGQSVYFHESGRKSCHMLQRQGCTRGAPFRRLSTLPGQRPSALPGPPPCGDTIGLATASPAVCAVLAVTSLCPLLATSDLLLLTCYASFARVRLWHAFHQCLDPHPLPALVSLPSVAVACQRCPSPPTQ